MIFAGLQQTAHSAQLDLSDLSLEQLLEVNVSSASKFEQRAADAPSAVQVISREDIRRYGWRTLSEALNSLPGMYFVNDRAYDYLGARGFQIPGDYNTRFLLLIDGERNNDNIYQQALTGSEGWLDMSVVERIEYIPGPGSAIYGSNAMFGVINVITRKAGNTPINQVSAYVTRLGQTGIGAMAGRQNDGTGLLLQFSAEHQAGRDQTYADPQGNLIRADGTVSPDGVAHGMDNADNRHLLMRLDRGEWGLKLINHERNIHPSSAPYATVFDDPSQKFTDGGTQLSGYVQHPLSGENSLYVRMAYTDWYFRATYPYLDPAAGYYHNYDDTRGQTVDGEVRFDSRMRSHHVIVGLDFSEDLLARQRNFNSIPAAALGGYDVNINTLIKRRGLFVQDEWRMAPAWLLSLGLREDSITGSSASTSPRLGLIWQPDRQWTAKLLAGQAYRSPNAYESQFGNGSTNLNNPGLQPERIQTTEAVFEWMKNEHTKWMLSVFDNRVSRLIRQVDTNGAGLMQYQNGSWAQVRGAELGLEHTSARELRLRGSVAFNDAPNGLNIAQSNSPGWLGKFSASAPVAKRAACLGGEFLAIGKRSYVWNGATYSRGGEFVANAVLTFPNAGAKGLQAQLRITNLFDRSIGYPASDEMSMPLVPGYGRNLALNVSYDY